MGVSDDDDARLGAALGRLIEAGTITQGQADAVRAEYRRAPGPAGSRADEKGGQQPWSAVVAEVGGYVGAAFVVAAATALVGSFWDDFSVGARLAPLIGGGVLLLVGALLIAREVPAPASGPRLRLVSVLLLGTAALLAGAAGVLHDVGLPDDAAPLVGFAVCLAGYVWQRGLLLHLGLAGTAWWSVLMLTDSAAGSTEGMSGLVSIALAVIWAALTVRHVFPEQSAGVLVAGAIGFIGAELLIIDDDWAPLGWVALVGLSAAGMAGYAVRRDLVTLAVGGLALAVVVPQFVIMTTDGALGASGALLLSGLLIVGGSVWALRPRT